MKKENKTMSKIKLKKASFSVQVRSLDNQRDLMVVKGETLTYRGHKLGIYRREHVGSKRQKYEYVLVDINTGLSLAVRPRKMYIVEDIEQETGHYLKRYMALIEKEIYKKQVEEFNRMKQKGAHDE